MSDEKIICILRLKGKINAASVTRLLAAYSALSGRRTLICETDFKNINENQPDPKDSSVEQLSANLDKINLRKL